MSVARREVGEHGAEAAATSDRSSAPRPFARPAAMGGLRLTAGGRPIPFFGPELAGLLRDSPEAGRAVGAPPAAPPATIDVAPVAAGSAATGAEHDGSGEPPTEPTPHRHSDADGRAGTAAGLDQPVDAAGDPCTATSGDAHAAALALESVARRLRTGQLRLPVRVDRAHPPAALAAVLAALHAEERRRASGAEGEGWR